MLGEYGTVGFIMLGAEHLLDIGNRVDAPIIGTVANIGDLFSLCFPASTMTGCTDIARCLLPSRSS